MHSQHSNIHPLPVGCPSIQMRHSCLELPQDLLLLVWLKNYSRIGVCSSRHDLHTELTFKWRNQGTFLCSCHHPVKLQQKDKGQVISAHHITAAPLHQAKLSLNFPSKVLHFYKFGFGGELQSGEGIAWFRFGAFYESAEQKFEIWTHPREAWLKYCNKQDKHTGNTPIAINCTMLC